MSRFPASVYRDGTEPDPRFSLANERTFLAWVRTSLALLAGGVGLEALEIPEHVGFRTTAAALLIVLGFLSIVQGWIGWARTERSLRRARALPGPTAGALVVLGILAVGILVALGLLS